MNGILSEWSTFWQVIAGIVFFVPVTVGWIDLFVDWGIKEDLSLFILGHFVLVFWPILIIYLALLFVVGCFFIINKILTVVLKKKPVPERLE